MAPETQATPRADVPELPDRVRIAVDALEEHKGDDTVVLDMRKVSGFTDYMVLCSGRNEPHVQALVKAIQEDLGKEGVKAGHVEGLGEARWVLVDYYDFIVHVFLPETRRFYQLERLWRDAPMLYQGADVEPPEASAGEASAEEGPVDDGPDGPGAGDEPSGR